MLAAVPNRLAGHSWALILAENEMKLGFTNLDPFANKRITKSRQCGRGGMVDAQR